MKKTLFVMSMLFAAACGGKSKGGGMDPCKDGKMAHMDCAGMADNMAKSMSASPDMPPEAVDQAHGVLVDQCTSTAWSQEAIDCMGMAATPDDGDKCSEMMTDDQKASLADAMSAGMNDGDGDDDGGGDEESMDEGGDQGME